jgi:hypothetical protein
VPLEIRETAKADPPAGTAGRHHGRRQTDQQRPWWASFIQSVGVPAAIALFSVYWITYSLEHRVTNLERSSAILEKVSGETLAIMKSAGESMHDFVVRNEQLETSRDVILRQICVNTSKPNTVGLCAVR